MGNQDNLCAGGIVWPVSDYILLTFRQRGIKRTGQGHGVLSFSFGGFCFIPLAFSIFFLTQTNLFCGYSRHIFLHISRNSIIK